MHLINFWRVFFWSVNPYWMINKKTRLLNSYIVESHLCHGRNLGSQDIFDAYGHFIFISGVENRPRKPFRYTKCKLILISLASHWWFFCNKLMKLESFFINNSCIVVLFFGFFQSVSEVDLFITKKCQF